MKSEVKIQKRVDASQFSTCPDAELWMDVPIGQRNPTTVQAKSILHRLEKKLGDEYRIIGVKQVYLASSKEVVCLREIKPNEDREEAI